MSLVQNGRGQEVHAIVAISLALCRAWLSTRPHAALAKLGALPQGQIPLSASWEMCYTIYEVWSAFLHVLYHTLWLLASSMVPIPHDLEDGLISTVQSDDCHKPTNIGR